MYFLSAREAPGVAQIQVTGWSELRSHAVAGQAFLVSGDLELLDAALAVANDDASAAEAWIGTGKLVRPISAQMKSFERGARLRGTRGGRP